MSARLWFVSVLEADEVEDTWNFRHGDEVTFAGLPSRSATVHRPRWWNLVAHIRWVVARWRGRTEQVTLSAGGVLRLIRR